MPKFRLQSLSGHDIEGVSSLSSAIDGKEVKADKQGFFDLSSAQAQALSANYILVGQSGKVLITD